MSRVVPPRCRVMTSARLLHGSIRRPSAAAAPRAAELIEPDRKVLEKLVCPFSKVRIICALSSTLLPAEILAFVRLNDPHHPIHLYMPASAAVLLRSASTGTCIQVDRNVAVVAVFVCGAISSKIPDPKALFRMEMPTAVPRVRVRNDVLK